MQEIATASTLAIQENGFLKTKKKQNKKERERKKVIKREITLTMCMGFGRKVGQVTETMLISIRVVFYLFSERPRLEELDGHGRYTCEKRLPAMRETGSTIEVFLLACTQILITVINALINQTL